MLRKTATIACAGAILAVTVWPADTFACGESLFRVGKGVAYREYTAPLPARILVVARSEGELALVERLAAAGHELRVVADPNEIGAELAAHTFDVVMALYEQHETVAMQTRDRMAGALYLPVAREGSPEEAEARAINGNAPTTGDDVKGFLKAIHRTLREAAAA